MLKKEGRPASVPEWKNRAMKSYRVRYGLIAIGLLAAGWQMGCENQGFVYTVKHVIIERPHTVRVGERYPKDGDSLGLVLIRTDVAEERCLLGIERGPASEPETVWVDKDGAVEMSSRSPGALPFAVVREIREKEVVIGVAQCGPR